MSFSLGEFFALESLYQFNHMNANDTKKRIPKKAPATIISRFLACAAVMIPPNAFGFLIPAYHARSTSPTKSMKNITHPIASFNGESLLPFVGDFLMIGAWIIGLATTGAVLTTHAWLPVGGVAAASVDAVDGVVVSFLFSSSDIRMYERN